MPLYKGGVGQKNEFDGLRLHIFIVFLYFVQCAPLSIQPCAICCFMMMMGTKARTLTIFPIPWSKFAWHSFWIGYGPERSRFWHLSCTDRNGIPSASSYRSARMNQNARPPVLWLMVFPLLVVLTPRDPLRPVFRQPLACMIIRTITPTACRNRLLLWVLVSARDRSMDGWDSSSRTTPDKGGRSWWISDSSIRRCLLLSLKNSRTASKGWSGSLATSQNLRPWLSSRNISRVIVTLGKLNSSLLMIFQLYRQI